MTHEPQDILARFHRALVRELRATNPEALTSPFSVSEIYQNLVPYRTHRDEIGVEMNGDYEHALLRLLAGEGEFLTIESRTARQEIREELESPNPNTALYRDFAAANVLLNPDKVDEGLDAWNAPMDERGEEQEGPEEQEGSEEQEGREESEGPEESEEPEDVEESEEPEDVQEEGETEEADVEVHVAVSEGDPEASEEGSGEEPTSEEPSEKSQEELQEEWRDPTSWLEPSIETLREEYEKNRAASLLESGEAVQGPEEVASGGLPFEVSVEKGTETGMEEPSEVEEAPAPEESPETEEPPPVEAAEEAVEMDESKNCAWCREKLPDRQGVNFCPFCGMSTKLVPCPECGEELELNWRFCIACGTEVSS